MAVLTLAVLLLILAVLVLILIVMYFDLHREVAVKEPAVKPQLTAMELTPKAAALRRNNRNSEFSPTPPF